MYDYSLVYTDYLQGSEELLLDKALTLISKTVALPRTEPYRLLLAIMLCSSSLGSKTMPRLFSYGLKGSGKSELAKLFARVRGVPLLASKTTYASIRNIINDANYFEPKLGFIEGNLREGSFLCWDNLRPDQLLLDTSTYQLLLSGYSRATSNIQISSGVAGTNLSFNCFSPVILSSIFPLHIDTEFDELHRRMITIPHKPFELFSEVELQQLQNDGGLTDIYDKIDIDDTDFGGLTEQYQVFWDDSARQTLSYNRKKILIASRGRDSVFRQASSTFFTLMCDVLANGFCLNAFKDLNEASEFFMSLYNATLEVGKQSESASMILLKRFIESATAQQVGLNQELIAAGLPELPLRVPAQDVKAHLDNLSQEGRLEKRVQVRERNQLMAALGYRLDAKSWVQIQ